ncbi:MOSC domain-containing protein [Umezawaea endophytica]|uniref:MOSC domain-containing protein n=1 Tax=Umezawaea endophytica TaxID=1654476 RepID=A0A9X2VJ71_9PSEU|nr:MOSC domain-containing protein [Umezawaea endophytica]MCS7477573.1 MOSC domain-containing protein [Umezawaea endophytica]
MDVQVVALLVSPVHAFEGRPQDGPLVDPLLGSCDRVEVRAGLGLVGDRFYAQPAHRKASVTVIAAESLDLITAELSLAAVPNPVLTRRNVVLRGFPVDGLPAGRSRAGALFSLDSGDGPVRFQAHRPASPCGWMDQVLAPGAHKALRGRGGVRCEPLDDGFLRVGPAVLTVL